jgi:8-oxo-dGTP diphosphatase
VNPRVGTAVFLLRDKKFLMLKRQGSHGSGQWSIPGGSLEYMEHWLDGARREVSEETDMSALNPEFLTVTNDLIEHEGVIQHWITIWMVAEADGEPVNMEPDKCSEMAWFDFDTLPRPLFGPWENLFEDKLFRRWLRVHTWEW